MLAITSFSGEAFVFVSIKIYKIHTVRLLHTTTEGEFHGFVVYWLHAKIVISKPKLIVCPQQRAGYYRLVFSSASFIWEE